MKGCNICEQQIVNADNFKVKKTRNMSYFTQKPNVGFYSFYDLVKDLIPDLSNSKERMIKGC